MMAHLPVLLVIVPLLTAPLCVLVKVPSLSRLLATFATFTSTLIATLLLIETLGTGSSISYSLGGWQPPIGIEYRVTKANAFVLLLTTLIASVSILLGTRETRNEVRSGRQHLFYGAFLLCVAGLLGMAITGDAFNIFVFLEISSLSTYALVAMGKRRKAFSAAFTYLILGTIGGTLVLIGIGLLFQATGTLNSADLAERLLPLENSRTVQVAFAFLVVGFAIKLAVFPLHQWLPNAYAEAPSAVSAFLAGTATKVIYFQLLRVAFLIFGAGYVFGTMKFGALFLAPLSLLAMFAGSIAAIYQTSLKRLLAYSSIGQVGYLTLALSLGSEKGLLAGLLHLGAHGITKAALFLVTAAIIARLGSDRLQDLSGLGKKMPLVAFGFVLGGIGLIGIPGTAGFVSKWALLDAMMDANHLLVALAILMSSLVAVVYVWRVVEIMYLQPAKDDTPIAPDWGALGPAYFLLAASIGFGVFSKWPTQFLKQAAAELFGGGT